MAKQKRDYEYEYLRKFLYFNGEDKHETEIFYILDKIRKYQSKLIIKLLDEFFAKNNITVNTPYDELQTFIKLYISNIKMPDESRQNPSIITGQTDMNAAILPMLITLTQQVSQLQAQSMNARVAPFPVSQKKELDVETQRTSEIIPHEEASHAFLDSGDEDEEDDDESLLQMVKGFQSMVSE